MEGKYEKEGLANIPVPGFNAEVLQAFKNNQSVAGDLLSILNVLSGGTLSNFSILAMGVYPYITASIILQLLGPIIPAIEEKMKNNPREGRQWMEKWTMYLTIPIAFISEKEINSLLTTNRFILKATENMKTPFLQAAV